MDTFTCRYCDQSRDDADQSALQLDEHGAYRSCAWCLATRPDLCNCCGTLCPGVDPAFRGLTLCRACAIAIDGEP